MESVITEDSQYEGGPSFKKTERVSSKTGGTENERPRIINWSYYYEFNLRTTKLCFFARVLAES